MTCKTMDLWRFRALIPRTDQAAVRGVILRRITPCTAVLIGPPGDHFPGDLLGGPRGSPGAPGGSPDSDSDSGAVT